MSRCPDCNSIDISGIVSSNRGDGRCKECKGTGHDKASEAIVQFGTLGTEGHDISCKICSGTGQCQTCGGTGKIYGGEDRGHDSSSYGRNTSSSSNDNGCAIAIGWIIGVVIAVLIVIWLAVNIVLPIALLNSALALTILALVRKQQKTLFASLALLGGCYMLFDIMNGWFSGNFVNNVVKDPGWISGFVYINSVAMGLCTWFLVQPIWANAKLVASIDKQKSILLKIISILLITIATALIPILYNTVHNPFIQSSKDSNYDNTIPNSNNQINQQSQSTITENSTPKDSIPTDEELQWMEMRALQGEAQRQFQEEQAQKNHSDSSTESTFVSYTPCTFGISLPSNFEIKKMYSDTSPDHCEYIVMTSDSFEILQLHSLLKSRFEINDIKGLYDTALKSSKLDITYKILGEDWFVISGLDIENRNVVYWKRISGSQFISDLRIEYPQSRTHQIEPYISKIEKSFSSQ